MSQKLLGVSAPDTSICIVILKKRNSSDNRLKEADWRIFGLHDDRNSLIAAKVKKVKQRTEMFENKEREDAMKRHKVRAIAKEEM